MKRVDCPHCRYSQVIAAMMRTDTVCRKCGRSFDVSAAASVSKAPKTEIALDPPQYARPSAILVARPQKLAPNPDKTF